MKLFPNVLLIGSTSKNAGKTLLATKLIRKFGQKLPIIAVKITTVHSDNERCHCNPRACNVCTKLKRDYEITREKCSEGIKDTQKLLSAGATDVYWIKAKKDHLNTAFQNLHKALPKDVYIICESNSLRDYILPALFIIVRNISEKNTRPAAIRNLNNADLVIYPNILGKKIEEYIENFSVAENRWTYKLNATATILAGGKSSRFGRDKSKEIINGKMIIESIFHQLSPYFKNIQLSRAKDNYSATKSDVFDEYTDIGPIAGIHSSLKNSKTDLNFIVACDNPKIDIDLMLEVIRKLKEFEVTIPTRNSGQYEPLFAGYQKVIYKRLEDQISLNNTKIIRALKDFEVGIVKLHKRAKIHNINTQLDLNNYLRE